MRKLLAVYLGLAVLAGVAVYYYLPRWAVACLAWGGGALFFWFVLYINRHSE